MERSGAAWQWLGSLCTPSHPVLGWHLWPGYPPDPVLSPSLPSSSQTSLTHVTLLKVAIPALDKKLPCLGNLTPQCQSYLLNPGLSSCCSPLPPLPVLLGAFDGLPLLSHLAQSQLSHGRDSGRHQHSVSQRSVPCPYQSPTLTGEHASPPPHWTGSSWKQSQCLSHLCWPGTNSGAWHPSSPSFTLGGRSRLRPAAFWGGATLQERASRPRAGWHWHGRSG